jgi:ribosomal protein S18 acetylase RimI-like enzyme
MMSRCDPNLVVRDARPDDAPAIAPLIDQLGFPAEVDVVRQRLEAMIRAGETVLVIERATRVLGLAALHLTPVLHRPTPVGRIMVLVVDEGSRGEGLGRALVEAAERRLALAGCALVEVTSNRQRTGAHAFYERLGYEVTSLRFRKLITPDETRPSEGDSL